MISFFLSTAASRDQKSRLANIRQTHGVFGRGVKVSWETNNKNKNHESSNALNRMRLTFLLNAAASANWGVCNYICMDFF